MRWGDGEGETQEVPQQGQHTLSAIETAFKNTVISLTLNGFLNLFSCLKVPVGI